MPETQAFSASRGVWTPPSGTLGELVARSYERAAASAEHEQAWREAAAAAPAPPSLRVALFRDAVAVIAELKRRSPSKGAINTALDAPARARRYVASGAAAVSVLTEPDRFGGSVADLATTAAAVEVPVVRKDFITSSIQLFEARANGAAAALLIVRALPAEALAELHDVGTRIGLELLVEIQDEQELDIALSIGARIIGVNNRNLESLVIDPEMSGRIIPLIPRSVVAVAESGMTSRADVERAARAGADAVLIGSSISAAKDPGAAVAALANVPSERDARRR